MKDLWKISIRLVLLIFVRVGCAALGAWYAAILATDPPLVHLAEARTSRGSLQVLRMSYGHEHSYLIDSLRFYRLKLLLPQSIAKYLPCRRMRMHTKENSFVLWTKLNKSADSTPWSSRIAIADQTGKEFQTEWISPITIPLGRSDIQAWKIPAVLSRDGVYHIKFLDITLAGDGREPIDFEIATTTVGNQ
jgi:hypothetical protein